MATIGTAVTLRALWDGHFLIFLSDKRRCFWESRDGKHLSASSTGSMDGSALGAGKIT